MLQFVGDHRTLSNICGENPFSQSAAFLHTFQPAKNQTQWMELRGKSVSERSQKIVCIETFQSWFLPFSSSPLPFPGRTAFSPKTSLTIMLQAESCDSLNLFDTSGQKNGPDESEPFRFGFKKSLGGKSQCYWMRETLPQNSLRVPNAGTNLWRCRSKMIKINIYKHQM